MQANKIIFLNSSIIQIYLLTFIAKLLQKHNQEVDLVIIRVVSYAYIICSNKLIFVDLRYERH